MWLSIGHIFGQDLSDSELESIKSVCKTRNYPKSSMIILEEEMGDVVFICACGSLGAWGYGSMRVWEYGSMDTMEDPEMEDPESICDNESNKAFVNGSVYLVRFTDPGKSDITGTD